MTISDPLHQLMIHEVSVLKPTDPERESFFESRTGHLSPEQRAEAKKVYDAIEDPFDIKGTVPLPDIGIGGKRFEVGVTLYLPLQHIGLSLIHRSAGPDAQVIVASFNPPAGSIERDEVCMAPMLDTNVIDRLRNVGILIGAERYIEHNGQALKVFKVSTDVSINAAAYLVHYAALEMLLNRSPGSVS